MTHCTENCSRDIVVTPVGLTDALLHTVGQWLKNQRLKADIQHERANLLTMSDSMLKDIGIGRTAAEQEAQRDDIPATRRL
jgi:uncharacterized protein YjiS (DUF1127 family)